MDVKYINYHTLIIFENKIIPFSSKHMLCNPIHLFQCSNYTYLVYKFGYKYQRSDREESDKKKQYSLRLEQQASLIQNEDNIDFGGSHRCYGKIYLLNSSRYIRI